MTCKCKLLQFLPSFCSFLFFIWLVLNPHRVAHLLAIYSIRENGHPVLICSLRYPQPSHILLNVHQIPQILLDHHNLKRASLKTPRFGRMAAMSK